MGPDAVTMVTDRPSAHWVKFKVTPFILYDLLKCTEFVQHCDDLITAALPVTEHRMAWLLVQMGPKWLQTRLHI